MHIDYHHTSTKTSTNRDLTDNYGRRIRYLRLAVTDRCNFQCVYCMPTGGVSPLSPGEILTFEELERLVRLFAGMGVTKLRITGGEPFVRKGLVEFLERIHNLPGVEGLYITTNGSLLTPHIPRLKEIGISGINLSLDTLQRERFIQISGRDALYEVKHALCKILQHEIPLKVNMVVQDGVNADEILPVSRLAETNPIEVRFVEQMPFDGRDGKRAITYPAKQIEELLQSVYPLMTKKASRRSTAFKYSVPGFKGSLGIIGGYSRTFCSTCNRVRVTPKGMLKTCLYDSGTLDLKALLREGAGNSEIQKAVRRRIGRRAKNGFEAEASTRKHNSESMALIGG